MHSTSTALLRATKLLQQADYHFTIQDGDLEMELCFLMHPEEIQVIWLVTRLGKSYPGGPCSLLQFELMLQASHGERVQWNLFPQMPVRDFKITGLEAYPENRGWPMSRLPWSARSALRRGTYQVYAAYEVRNYVEAKTYQNTMDLGSMVLEYDALQPSQRPMNELGFFEPDWADIEQGFFPKTRAVPESCRILVDRFRAGLDGVCEHLRTWRCDPYNTEHRPGSRLNPAAYLENARGFGMVLPGLSYGYLATSNPEYYTCALYAHQKMVDNIWESPWGWSGDIWSMHEMGNLLLEGINFAGAVDFYEVIRDTSLIEPFYYVFKAWPVDKKRSSPKNEINSQGQDVHPSFVYNQVLTGIRAFWMVGHLFQDRHLMKFAKEGLMREILPDFTDEGYWNYNRGGALSTHYDILLKSHIGALLWYRDWRDDPEVVHCALKGADFCLRNVAEENEDECVWSGKYGQEDSLMLALGKAGMMVEVLAPLVDLGYTRYATPLKKTVAFILNRKDEPEIRDFWDSAWAQFSVVAPLLRAAYRGVELL